MRSWLQLRGRRLGGWRACRWLSTVPTSSFDDNDDRPGSSNARKRETHTTWKFVDRVQIEVKGGRGGNGCVSYEVLSPGRKRPSGGSGGKGGSVFVVADRGLTGMKFQTFHFNARDGTHGGSAGLTGRRGEDILVRVPLGTIVSEKRPLFLAPSRALRRAQAEAQEEDEEEDEEDDEEGCDERDDYMIDGGDDREKEKEEEEEEAGGDETGEAEEEDEEGEEQGGEPRSETRLLRELNEHGDTMVVAEGGVPGIGNAMMSGSASKRNRSVPLTKLPGQPGEARSLLLELKIIADVGLVGYPNAGKSTLLRALSNARPKVRAIPLLLPPSSAARTDPIAPPLPRWPPTPSPRCTPPWASSSSRTASASRWPTSPG